MGPVRIYLGYKGMGTSVKQPRLIAVTNTFNTRYQFLPSYSHALSSSID